MPMHRNDINSPGKSLCCGKRFELIVEKCRTLLAPDAGLDSPFSWIALSVASEKVSQAGSQRSPVKESTSVVIDEHARTDPRVLW